MTTVAYTGSLVVTSCWCGVGMAIPSDLYDWAQRDHSRTVYCPLGHTWVFAGETDAVRYRRLLHSAEDRNAFLTADLDQARASLRTTKGVVTKMRKRAIAGVCAFCHRQFQDVSRHVVSKHPEERP